MYNIETTKNIILHSINFIFINIKGTFLLHYINLNYSIKFLNVLFLIVYTVNKILDIAMTIIYKGKIEL